MTIEGPSELTLLKSLV